MSANVNNTGGVKLTMVAIVVSEAPARKDLLAVTAKPIAAIKY